LAFLSLTNYVQFIL